MKSNKVKKEERKRMYKVLISSILRWFIVLSIISVLIINHLRELYFTYIIP